MPLPKPTLDNRRFDQLVSECRGLLSRSAPEWTDHNASDPGITLLELGAWLGEQNIYRFDRLSDAAMRAFVRLVGIEARPPGVARTVVAVESPGGNAIRLPARVQLGAPNNAALETTDELFVSPAVLARVLVGRTALTDASANLGPRGEFPAFGSRPRPGDAIHLGFDRALDAPGATLSLHVRTDRWARDDATRITLELEQSARRDRPRGSTTDWRRHYRVQTTWEYAAAGDTWLPLQDVVDETRALTLTGFVRFAAPLGHRAHGPGGLFFVRCRIVGGRFECPPRLAHIAFNAVACEHARTRGPRGIGTSRGHAGAVFAAGEAPIVAGTMRLALDDARGHVQTDWREVDAWDRVGPHDRAFRLDGERGEIQSGDGLRGAILPAGNRLVATFRVGGGLAGNVAAGTLTDVPPTPENLERAPELAALVTPLVVRQPFGATGGSAQETLAAAQARAFDAFTLIDKAVTLEDVERLALATPGIPIARVRAIASVNPRLPCYPAPGIVTVVVIPSCPRPAPMPSRALLDAVARHLEARRLVTSEIRVVAPRYRRVGVAAVLHVGCDADPQRTLALARARIDDYFDPLTGGSDGTGWPFGRAVYRSEIMARLARTSGVERVTSLGFLVGAGAGHGAICDNVALCPNELVRAGEHRLRVERETATTPAQERAA